MDYRRSIPRRERKALRLRLRLGLRQRGIKRTHYTYDGDNRRVKKSNGKLYWYGVGGSVLGESDLSGTMMAEYVFFNGQRVARRDPGSGNVFYYIADALGSSRVITNSTLGVVLATNGTVKESDFLPYGTERVITDTGAMSPDNTYKFTGDERDAESGLDHTEYRQYSSNTGRWLSADPLQGTAGNPQSWNRYGYVGGDPIGKTDPDGRCSPGYDSCLSPTAALTQMFGGAWASAAASTAAAIPPSTSSTPTQQPQPLPAPPQTNPIQSVVISPTSPVPPGESRYSLQMLGSNSAARQASFLDIFPDSDTEEFDHFPEWISVIGPQPSQPNTPPSPTACQIYRDGTGAGDILYQICGHTPDNRVSNCVRGKLLNQFIPRDNPLHEIFVYGVVDHASDFATCAVK